jgi:hypothetical protein
MKQDILCKTPKIGDKIIFIQPKYHRLVIGTVIGFGTKGHPKVNDVSIERDETIMSSNLKTKGYHLVLTDFYIKEI